MFVRQMHVLSPRQHGEVPVHVYADIETVEQAALSQLRELASSGVVVSHVAAMPDVHLGKGATVGSVFCTKEFVAPNAVGVDIGCGMAAVRVKGLFKDISINSLKQIQAQIKQRVPCGFNEHRNPLSNAAEKIKALDHGLYTSQWLQRTLKQKHVRQLGSLGGGNHFLELVYDELDRVWIMLHSGSRNIGNITAAHHDQIAKSHMRTYGLPKTNHMLNFLKIDTAEGQDYLNDMEWCQRYAMENRQQMLAIMKDVVFRVTGCRTEEDSVVNIHHNYCTCESCTYTDEDGRQVTEDLWVTRKGATSAKEGQLGIIPGSMATGSYIVRGKGHHGMSLKLDMPLGFIFFLQHIFTECWCFGCRCMAVMFTWRRSTDVTHSSLSTGRTR